MQLGGATIVLTGASSGIGREIALRLADRGANIVLAARREVPLQTLADECRQRGGDALPFAVDVADEAAVEALAHAALERYGKIDGWINDASVSLVGHFEELPPNAFRRTMDVNFFGVVHGCRAALRAFERTNEGVIVNVASLAGRVGAPYYSAYASAKHAVVGFSQSLRMELAGTRPGIRVCTVMPAAIDTPFFQHSGNYAGRPFKPLRPFYRPEMVANLIVRLLERPRPEAFAGEAATLSTWLRTLSPRLFERTYRTMVERDHFLQEPRAATPGNVFEPLADGTTVTGGWSERQASMATSSRVAGLATVAALGAGLLGLVRLAMTRR